MEDAAKLLIVGGVLNLAYGMVIGLPMTRARQSSANAPRYLLMAHIGPLMQGPMLLGLALASTLSDLPASGEVLAAALLVAGSASIALGDTLNWLGGVQDSFAERPVGFYLAAFSALLALPGIGIFVIGVFRGL